MNKLLKPISTVTLILFVFMSIAKTDSIDKPNNNFDIYQTLRSIALIYKDDPLDLEVEKFIKYQPEIIWEDNAYVYLWGMDKVTDTSYATGKKILKRLLDEDKIYDYDKHPLNIAFLNEYKTYFVPESEILCKKHEIDCIQTIIEKEIMVKDLLSEFGFYTFRYEEFLSYKYFNQIADRRLESAIPSFRTLTIAQKIYHIDFLAKISNNTNHEVSRLLIDELRNLKNLLKQADSLINKMIVIALINENLELFNYLLQNNLITLKQENFQVIFKSFTKPERSIFKAMYEEHSKWLKFLYDNISDIEKLIKRKPHPSTMQLMKLVSFIIAKPNLTVNTIYHDYIKKLLDLTKSNISTYYKGSTKLKKVIKHDPIRNYIPYKSMNDIMPDYHEYQMRIYDIEMKLQLMVYFNQTKSTSKQTFSNAYLSSYDQTPPYKDNSKLCYTGIAKLFPEYRCINIYQ